ncbi:hypothetical protein PV327_008081 [Microctonus hyperodae]|uniref:Uncharacterized protein n=1 Tax=Microctonus hyperodae TaxID=165561 RepID=A0AA39F2D8_MICHY|nr:hypothetical protein PV327_008081 [Microctonus hyperodae]
MDSANPVMVRKFSVTSSEESIGSGCFCTSDDGIGDIEEELDFLEEDLVISILLTVLVASSEQQEFT